MSASAEKKRKQSEPALATTGRGAALYITLGIFMLTLGAAWVLSLMGVQESYAIQQMSLLLWGLGGPLCFALPALFLWGGAKLVVSSRHRVSARNFFLIAGLYLLSLAFHALIARVPQGMGNSVPYLDFVRTQAESVSLYGQGDFTACLNQAYLQRASGAGGLLGMLIAYPLTHLFTRIGAVFITAALIVTLVLLLFRFHPGRMVRTLSAMGEKRQAAKAKRRQEKASAPEQPDYSAGNPSFQSAYMPEMNEQPTEQTPPSYYQPAPVYQMGPAASPRQDAQGFFAVQPDLYEENFSIPNTAAPSAMEEPAWRKQTPFVAEPVPVEEPLPAEKPKRFSRMLDKLMPQNEKSEKNGKSPVPVKPAPAPDYPAPPAQSPTNPAPFASSSTQALDDTEDDLPWEVPVPEKPMAQSSAIPAPRTVSPVPQPAVPSLSPEKKPVIPPIEETEEEIAPAADYKPRHMNADPQVSPPSAPAQPADHSWAAQVKEKKAELELPKHAAEKAAAKPVYTDPVMPITGEKIAITPRAEKTEIPGVRLDGTTAPQIRQQKPDENIAYQAPPIRLLKESRNIPQADAAQEDERRAQIIEGTLRSFGVESEVKQIMHGPSITRFAIQIAPGVKVSRVSNTADNLALELKTKHVRVEAPIQGTNYIGIEVPNQLVSTVALREVLDSPEMHNHPSPLLVALGKDIAGAPVLCDLSKMPHLLIAGATGSGKSVCINSIVCSLLYRASPDQVRLIMIDPKQVELSVYNTIPHLLVPVISDPKKAAGALAWVVQEMLERYGKFTTQGVRNLAGYNKVNQGTDKVLPNIVIIIDEMADLMEVCRKDVEDSIRRLAALARAAGIYMVLATQRPSVDVITGVIKNNIPSRIAFAVTSGTDSRTIIDINGAEKLMGKGDMLYKPAGTSALRVQGCLVTDDEVNAIAEYIGSRYQTDFDPNIVDHLENTGKERTADEISGSGDDEASAASGDGSFLDLLQQAIEMAVEDGQTSTSMLQRRLRVGYARAGRLIDEMEKRGIISQSEGSKPRKTIITREQYYEMTNHE